LIEDDVENITGILCEHYLPRVLQYVHYWVKDTGAAEELTLNALRKALAKSRYCYYNEKKFSAVVFDCARKEVLDCAKEGAVKPIFPGLSTQEQEVISLRLGAALNNRTISKLLGLSESIVGAVVRRSLGKLKDCKGVPAGSRE
jgi:DNA-directed RNA polymerase specialized sigma24 family protein